MKLTVIAGKAHLKHTEGGDFRQASYRAVRQGLMKAKSVLLEPVYDFVLELPSELLGRAINDIALMNGKLDDTRSAGENVILYGSAPVRMHAGISDYRRILFKRKRKAYMYRRRVYAMP